MKKFICLLIVSFFVLGALPMPSQTPLLKLNDSSAAAAGFAANGEAAEENDAEANFELAVEMIKKYETLNTVAHWPYVGYGHRVKKGEKFARRNLTEKEADELLRKDLSECIALFSDYGDDALVLGVLAYSVGPYRLLGAGKKIAKSRLLEKLERGDRDVKSEYLSYSKYKGRPHKGLKKRRLEEFEALFEG